MRRCRRWPRRAATLRRLPRSVMPRCKPTWPTRSTAINRLAARVRQLETRLSQLLGEQAWHASGLGAPADVDELHRKLTRLEQVQIDLTAQLDERAEELRAAREANRELTRALNQRH